MRDLQWGKWRYLNIFSIAGLGRDLKRGTGWYLNIIREQGGERLTMGEVEVFNIIREQGG